MMPTGGEQEISMGKCFLGVGLAVGASDVLSEVCAHCKTD